MPFSTKGEYFPLTPKFNNVIKKLIIIFIGW
jgi:hypothetical protein